MRSSNCFRWAFQGGHARCTWLLTAAIRLASISKINESIHESRNDMGDPRRTGHQITDSSVATTSQKRSHLTYKRWILDAQLRTTSYLLFSFSAKRRLLSGLRQVLRTRARNNRRFRHFHRIGISGHPLSTFNYINIKRSLTLI